MSRKIYISPLFFVSHLRFVTDTRNIVRSFGASRDTYATRRFHASGFRHSCTQSLGGLLSVPLTRATSPPHTASAEHCTCKKEHCQSNSHKAYVGCTPRLVWASPSHRHVSCSPRLVLSGLPPSVTEEMMIISSDHPKQTRTLEGRHCPEAASGIQPREHTDHQPPLMKTGIVQGW